MHALIIEDESLIALAIEEALRDCGFTSFDLAVSADEAVAAASRRCPDLITADVELRPGNGIDAVQSICSELPIPVVFITGRPIEVRTRMPQHASIEKPFSTDHIVAAIKLAFGPTAGSTLGAGLMTNEPPGLSRASGLSRSTKVNKNG